MYSRQMRIILLLVFLFTIGWAISSCQTQPGKQTNDSPKDFSQDGGQIILATTTSTQDSGLLDSIIPPFEKRYRIKVKVVAVGTGQAFALGQQGDADVLLVHARADELKFVAAGWGVNRRDVMHNQFILVGPAGDPAGVKTKADISAALQSIYRQQRLFVSRGDDSGTHKKEMALWKAGNLAPNGAWYIEAGQGMGDTLIMASEKQAYTLADEATFLSMKDKLELIPVKQGDQPLLNSYGAIAVNPAKFPSINYDGAMKFITYLTSIEGQKLINQFGRDKFGKALFIPDAIPPR